MKFIKSSGINLLMKRMKFLYVLFTYLLLFGWPLKSGGQPIENDLNYNEPIRPGIPGKRPFWNVYSKRFMYAPAFDFKKIKNAGKYKFEILSDSGSKRIEFLSDIPYASLTSIWPEVPQGFFEIKVKALSKDGNELGLSGLGRYYKAEEFKKLLGHEEIPYEESGLKAIEELIKKGYFNFWLDHKYPDPDFPLYRYPAKMVSAVINAGIVYNNFGENEGKKKLFLKIAENAADYLIGICFKKGEVWEYFPPTYHGPWIDSLKPSQWMNTSIIMPKYGPDVGNVLLDLYEITKKQKYLDVAFKIGATLKKNQLRNGTWYLYVNHENGLPLYKENNLSIPILIINYLSRLKSYEKNFKTDKVIKMAIKWIMENPVKTFNWQGQFEDVGVNPPYKDMSNREACEFAIYLFRNKKENKKLIDLGKELLRYAEDQFIVWGKPRPLNENSKVLWRRSSNWILPSVQEQYNYWMPVSFSVTVLMKSFWEAYKATGEEVFLLKAKSLANSIEAMQKVNGGKYSAYFTKYPVEKGEDWINCVVYPAQEMILFGLGIKEIK